MIWFFRLINLAPRICANCGCLLDFVRHTRGLTSHGLCSACAEILYS